MAWLGRLLFCASFASAPLTAVGYDVVYVRQPRFGDTINTLWPEVFHPARLDPGAGLMLLHPDGAQDLLVAVRDLRSNVTRVRRVFSTFGDAFEAGSAFARSASCP